MKALAGNPGRRPLNANEPQFTGTPNCPSWLNTAAKAEWKRVVAELKSLDMLRGVDTAALAGYCQAYAK
jgi:phage terminase small subunit